MKKYNPNKFYSVDEFLTYCESYNDVMYNDIKRTQRCFATAIKRAKITKVPGIEFSKYHKLSNIDIQNVANLIINRIFSHIETLEEIHQGKREKY